MTIPTRVKDSLRTAIAMVMAYGLALKFDWERPMWAAFTVAMVSLSTRGTSFNKELRRFLGMLLALVVVLVVTGLFYQSRWLYFLFLSGFVGLCAYMQSVGKNDYFWFVAGFVAVIVAVDGGVESVNVFDTILNRAEEASLGAVCYGIAALTIWPKSSREDFLTATQAYLDSLRNRTQLYYSAMFDPPAEDALVKSTLDGQSARNSFESLLDAAEVDSYQVSEAKNLWQQLSAQTLSFSESLDTWRTMGLVLHQVPLGDVFAGLSRFRDAIDERLATASRLVSGDTRAPGATRALDLTVDETRLNDLPPVYRGAVTALREVLSDLDGKSRSIVDTADGIASTKPDIPAPSNRESQPVVRLHIDRERMESALQLMFRFWALILIITLVPGVQGKFAALVFLGVEGLVLAGTPFIPIGSIMVPTLITIGLTALIYMLVMPALSTFLQLSLIIFPGTFLIYYAFYAPAKGSVRAIALANFIAIISVGNEQTYGFMGVAVPVMGHLLITPLFFVTKLVPRSSRSEQAFSRMLKRYFARCGELLSGAVEKPNGERPSLRRWRRAGLEHDLDGIPGKLRARIPFMNSAVRDANSNELQALTLILDSVTLRMRVLLRSLETHRVDRSCGIDSADVEQLTVTLLAVLQRLSSDLVTPSAERLEKDFDASLDRLGDRLASYVTDETSGAADDARASIRLLNSYRGLCDVLVEYDRMSAKVDWELVQEPRFIG